MKPRSEQSSERGTSTGAGLCGRTRFRGQLWGLWGCPHGGSCPGIAGLCPGAAHGAGDTVTPRGGWVAPAPVPIPEGLRVPEQAAVSQPCPPPGCQSPGRPGGGRATPRKGLWGFGGGLLNLAHAALSPCPGLDPPVPQGCAWMVGGSQPGPLGSPPNSSCSPAAQQSHRGLSLVPARWGLRGGVCGAPPSYKHLHPHSRTPRGPAHPILAGCWPRLWGGFSLRGFL